MQEQVDTSQAISLTIPASATPEVRKYLKSLGCSFYSAPSVEGESRELLEFPPGTKREWAGREAVSERHLIQLPNNIKLYEIYDVWRSLSILSFDKEGSLAFLKFTQQQTAK